jgi:hypothetical protein
LEDEDFYTAADFYGSDADVEDEAGDEDETPEVTEVATRGTEDAGPTVEGGQAEVTAENEGTYFDPSPYADQLVRVKVDGEEVAVPVADLVNGYSRTADYTRKTQELAQERQNLEFWKQVEAAMQVDPAQTLQYLSQQFGVQVAQQASDAFGDDDEWADPADVKLREFQQQVAPALEYVERQQAVAYLDSVISNLTQRYGDEFNAQEVMKYAVDRGVHNPDMLEACFKEMMFEKYRARSAAEQQTAAQRAAEDARRQAAAATAGTVIGQGSSSSGGAAAGAPHVPAGKLTIAEAYALAKAELGVD